MGSAVKWALSLDSQTFWQLLGLRFESSTPATQDLKTHKLESFFSFRAVPAAYGSSQINWELQLLAYALATATQDP